MYTEKHIELVKKQWLFAFLVYSFLGYLPTLMMNPKLVIGVIPCFDLSLAMDIHAWAFEQVIIVKLLLFFLVTWLVYFFAYKTGGIKLLSCIWFIGGLIFALFQFYGTISWLFQTIAHSGLYSYEFAFDTGFISFRTLIDVFYIYFSYQLFCVNKFLLYKDDK